MMKYGVGCIFNLIIALSFLANSKAEALVSPVSLISAKKFLQLPNDKQLEYLRRLSAILLEIDESSDSMASNINWIEIFLIQKAHAESGEIVGMPQTVEEAQRQYFRDIRFTAKIRDEVVTANTTDAADIAMKKFTDLAKNKEFLIEPDTVQAKSAMMILLGEIQASLDKGDQKGAQEAKRKLDSIYLDLTTNYFLKMAPEPRNFLNSIHSISGRIKAVSDKNGDGAAPKVSQPSRWRAGASAKNSSPKVSRGTGELKEQRVPVEALFQFRGCLYAGFVLTTSDCAPPRELPLTFDEVKEFDKKTFFCKMPEIICNPLLFGFEAKCKGDQLGQDCSLPIRPVCQSPSQSITAKCASRTKDPKYLKRAQSLIRLYPLVWEAFKADFDLVCDEKNMEKNRNVYFDSLGQLRKNPQYIKNDITKSCEMAGPKFRVLNDWYENILIPSAKIIPPFEESGQSSR